MITPTLETISLPDGYSARVRWWRPQGPRGAVLYLHGIQSHGGWYESSAARLAEQGLAVLMPDRRGSGLNQPQRGHAESAEQMLDDAECLLNALLDATALRAAHLVGISWGGKLAVALAHRCPGRVRSLSLVAPGLFPVIDLSPMDKLRVGMAMFNDRERLFDIPLNSAELFTDVPRWVRFVEQDALKLPQVTAGFLLASRRLDRLAAAFPAAGWPGGLHLMLAGRERIIDNDQTRVWFRRCPLSDRRLTEYPDGMHTLEFLFNPETFLTDLVNWIVDRSN